MSVERDQAAEAVGASASARLRLTRTSLLATAVLAIGAAALGGYWVLRPGDVARQAAAPSAPQASSSVAPRDLTNDAARHLLAEALSRRPVVARLALGDVATVDKNRQALPLYPNLAQAEVVRLRYCRFPGADAPANQICLADLTEKAKPYVYPGDSASKTIAVSGSDLQAKNRSFALLILAVPRVTRVTQISDRRRGEKWIAYTGAFELTPLASAFGMSADSLPSSLTGTADARAVPTGWSIENDGLRQIDASAN